jgi:hypothetical protein
MVTRTTGAIALRPTGNTQGGYMFYSLTTGQCISRNRWTMLPMPTDVIDRINKLSRRDLDNRETLLFADWDQLIIPDEFNNNDSDSDDYSYHPAKEEDIDNDRSFNNEEVGDDAVVDPVDIPADALVEDNNGNALDGNDLNVDLNIPGVDANILPENHFHPDADIAGVDDQAWLINRRTWINQWKISMGHAITNMIFVHVALAATDTCMQR